jgi:hypothetical protein
MDRRSFLRRASLGAVAATAALVLPEPARRIALPDQETLRRYWFGHRFEPAGAVGGPHSVVMSQIASVDQNHSVATITWETDAPGSYEVYYGETAPHPLPDPYRVGDVVMLNGKPFGIITERFPNGTVAVATSGMFRLASDARDVEVPLDRMAIHESLSGGPPMVMQGAQWTSLDKRVVMTDELLRDGALTAVSKGIAPRVAGR